MSITIIDDSKESEEKQDNTQQVDVGAIVESTASAVAEAIVDVVNGAKESGDTTTNDDKTIEFYLYEITSLVDSINRKIDTLLAMEVVEELENREEPEEPEKPEEPEEPEEPEIVNGIAETLDNPAETIVELTSKPKGKQWI